MIFAHSSFLGFLPVQLINYPIWWNSGDANLPERETRNDEALQKQIRMMNLLSCVYLSFAIHDS